MKYVEDMSVEDFKATRTAPSMFGVGYRVAYENLGFWSFGTVVWAGREYEVKWEDGYVDPPNEDGTPHTYDGWELIPAAMVSEA